MPTLDSDQLEAFAAVAAEGGFTRGAKRVGVTQSAVSQRVRKLEETLSVTLLVRRRDQVQLTREGEALLRYARAREGLEDEMLRGIQRKDVAVGEHVGVLRVAGFSSVTRSILLPAMASLLAENPSVTVHAFARELHELPRVFRSGEADFVITDRPLVEAGVESVRLGDEQNVLVDARVPCANRILDHDPDDTITDRFARLNKLSFEHVPRSYLDDIYGILEGVLLGWGRAVVSAHLVPSTPGLRIVPGHKPLKTAVYLHTRAARYRTRLEQAAMDAIQTEFVRVLGKTRPKKHSIR